MITVVDGKPVVTLSYMLNISNTTHTGLHQLNGTKSLKCPTKDL